MHSDSRLVPPRTNVLGSIESAVWLVLCVVLAWAWANGAWAFAGAIVGIFVMIWLFVAGMRFIATAWLCGIPTVFVVPNNILKSLPIITVDRLLFVALVASVVAGTWLHKVRRLRFDTLEKTMIVFIVMLLLSLLTKVLGKRPRIIKIDIVFLIQGYLMPLAAFMIGRRMEWSEKKAKSLLWALAAAGQLAVAIGIAMYFFKIPYFFPKYLQIDYFNRHAGEYDRIVGTFGNAPEYGAVLGVFCLLVAALVLWSKDAAVRAGVALLIAPLLAGMVLTKTRNVWLMTALAFAYLHVKDRRIRPWLVTSTAIAGTLIVVSLPWLLQFHFVTDLFQRVDAVNPIYNRVALYSTAVNIVLHNPVFGVGFARYGFVEAMPHYFASIFSVSPQWAAGHDVPHNEYLHIGALTGLVGLALYLRILFLALKLLKQTRNAPHLPLFMRQSALYIMAIFLLYIAFGLFIDTGLFNYLGILVWFLVGVVTSPPPAELARPVRASAKESATGAA